MSLDELNALLAREEQKQLELDKEMEVTKRQVLERLSMQAQIIQQRVEQGLNKTALADSAIRAKMKTMGKPSGKGLRNIEELSHEVDKRLASLGLGTLAEQDLDTTSGEEISEEEEDGVFRSKKSRGKELKSGKNAKVTSKVLKPQLWPQSELSLSFVTREVKYEDLSKEEFVAGFTGILMLKSLSNLEKDARIEH